MTNSDKLKSNEKKLALTIEIAKRAAMSYLTEEKAGEKVHEVGYQKIQKMDQSVNGEFHRLVPLYEKTCNNTVNTILSTINPE